MIVRRLNRVAVAKAQLAAVKREVARRKRVATRGEALLNKNPRVQHVLKSFGFTFDNLCIPVASNDDGTPLQDAQAPLGGRRRQALRELNVTCPAP